MDTIISFLEKLVHYSAELGIVLAELAGIAILIITAVKGVVSYFKHNEHLRLELAQGIALALEFKLGGEVLRTVIVREWTELLILGCSHCAARCADAAAALGNQGGRRA